MSNQFSQQQLQLQCLAQERNRGMNFPSGMPPVPTFPPHMMVPPVPPLLGGSTLPPLLGGSYQLQLQQQQMFHQQQFQLVQYRQQMAQQQQMAQHRLLKPAQQKQRQVAKKKPPFPMGVEVKRCRQIDPVTGEKCNEPAETKANGELLYGTYSCLGCRRKGDAARQKLVADNKVMGKLGVHQIKAPFLKAGERQEICAELMEMEKEWKEEEEKKESERGNKKESSRNPKGAPAPGRKTRSTNRNVEEYNTVLSNIPDHPNHEFNPLQFYDDDVLWKMIGHWKDVLQDTVGVARLGDGAMSIPINEIRPYNDKHRRIAEDSREICFRYKLMKSRAAASSEGFTVDDDDDDMPALFRRTESHHNHIVKEGIEFLQPHTDSMGGMVTIYVNKGTSWTFVLVPGPTKQKGKIDKKEAIHFDTNHGDYAAYVKWRDGLEEKDQDEYNLVLEYEAELKRKNAHFYIQGNNTIVVYKLTEGQRLIFNAKELCHGVIIPGGQARSVLVFHDLDPRMSIGKGALQIRDAKEGRARNNPTKAGKASGASEAATKKGDPEKHKSMLAEDDAQKRPSKAAKGKSTNAQVPAKKKRGSMTEPGAQPKRSSKQHKL